MLKLGIIGTGMISGEFATAVNATGAFEVTAVMSRSGESAQKFIDQFTAGATPVTDVEALLSQEIDAVYIASPNGHHFDHALVAITAGKQVIVEKPAFWNLSQWEQVHAAAKNAGVLVLEAARHLFEPGFQAVQNWADHHRSELTGADLNFHQYSSRWDAVLAGEEPNIFSLKHGGGALVDIGIYSVYAAVSWLGVPQGIKFKPELAPTWVDAGGKLLLEYSDFTAVLNFSKNQNSGLSSELRAGKHALTFSSVQSIAWAKSADGSQIFAADFTNAPLNELMQFEAKAFAELISAKLNHNWGEGHHREYERLTQLSKEVNRICAAARHQAGIFYLGEPA